MIIRQSNQFSFIYKRKIDQRGTSDRLIPNLFYINRYPIPSEKRTWYIDNYFQRSLAPYLSTSPYLYMEKRSMVYYRYHYHDHYQHYYWETEHICCVRYNNNLDCLWPAAHATLRVYVQLYSHKRDRCLRTTAPPNRG